MIALIISLALNLRADPLSLISQNGYVQSGFCMDLHSLLCVLVEDKRLNTKTSEKKRIALMESPVECLLRHVTLVTVHHVISLWLHFKQHYFETKSYSWSLHFGRSTGHKHNRTKLHRQARSSVWPHIGFTSKVERKQCNVWPDRAWGKVSKIQ